LFTSFVFFVSFVVNLSEGHEEQLIEEGSEW